MRQDEIPRAVVSAVILIYFGYALVTHWSEGIEETVKNLAMIAVGYWLGSSKGSADKSEILARDPSGNPDVIPGDKP